MRKYLFLLCLGFSINAKAQTDMPLNVPGIGHGATVNNSTYRFTYAGFPVSHYGLGWYMEGGQDPRGYLSGYGGLRFFTDGNPRMSISLDGNVGIGILSPTEKLSVKGKIRAQEIKVETANWPDYVFAKDYALPSLQQTEKHIQEKGHLPGIPSAEEVKANGVDLGEMNAKLLQKIEEMTLIMIRLNKQVQQQAETLKMQQKQLDKLK